MTLTHEPVLIGGNADAARGRRNLLVTGYQGRVLTETIGRPLIRALHAAQAYSAAAKAVEHEPCNAPSRRWLRAQAAVCHRRARIAADESALAIEDGQPHQAATWAALASCYATAGRRLAREVSRPGDAITMLRAAAEALEKAGRPGGGTSLAHIPLFRIDAGRQALAAARGSEGPVLKHLNAVEVELLLLASYAEGQAETGYHLAMQAVRALDRARKSAPEGEAEAMDPQTLATAYQLAQQALDAAEEFTGHTGETTQDAALAQ